MDMYDLIILGTGPAGMTAQVYAERYKLKTLTIGSIAGGLMTESHKIGNFPGENFISGMELTNKMQAHVKEIGCETVLGQVSDIQKNDGNSYKIITADNKEYLTKNVLFTLGTEHRRLGLDNEAKLVGRGVAYCATCDAMFYKDKIVAVAGSGNSAVTAALHLSNIAKQVYLIYRGEELKSEPAWTLELSKKENVTLIASTNVVGLVGENKLEKIILDKEFNGNKEIELNGLFIEIGTMPRSQLFQKIGGEVDERGYIKVDRSQKTNLPNFWAAGDITDGSNNFRQIITACSEGSIAVNSIFVSNKE